MILERKAPTRLAGAAALATTLMWQTAAVANGTSEGGVALHGGHGFHGGGWILGPIVMLVFLATIVVVAVLVVRWTSGTGPGQTAPAAPVARTSLDILKDRFARGEIEAEEFESRRRFLET